MSQYHFDYSVQEDIMNSSNNQITEDTILYGVTCNFCNEFGHTVHYCVSARSIGQSLHLKGIEVRKYDIEMECSGNSVKIWVENLTFIQIIVLSNRINLIAYTNSLWERGMINEDTSFLNIREDYNICLRFFYYYEPTGENLPKKMDFSVELLESVTTETNQIFDCPICIENKLEIKEMVLLNCSHKVCNTCFHDYLTHSNFDKHKKPICSLCRCTIKNANFVDSNHLNNVKNIFDFN